jgi:hypothetical protein
MQKRFAVSAGTRTNEKVRSMFGWFPDWTVAVAAVILGMLVGTWTHRASVTGLELGKDPVGCQHALINLC